MISARQPYAFALKREFCSLAAGLLAGTLFAVTSCAAADAPAVSAGQGIMVGEVTPTTAVVQVRLTNGTKLVDKDLPGAAGVVEFTLEPLKQNVPREPAHQILVVAKKQQDHIARATFKALTPGVRYICRTRIGRDEKSLSPGPSAKFSTLAGPQAETKAKFVVVTGMNYAKFHGDDRIDRKQHLEENNTELPKPYAGPDKHLGYPALASILKRKPDFFVGTGDNVYYDTPDKFRAKTESEMRQKWHEQFVQPRYKDLFASVPTYWMIDDHDYRVDDGDNSGDYLPTPATGRKLMLEQLPLAAHDDKDALTYRTHRINKDLQIWFPENRMYRSPNLSPDGPKKTIWGEKQKAWLKKTLADSDATFKLLISPTPMVGPDDLRKTDNHTNIGGFRHEREEFFQWIKEQKLDQNGFAIVCGDRHWQYHAVDPTGIQEFSCGALVDANSRLGRKPGDPKSTDPEALIKQLYTQQERSAGFLEIELTPADKKNPSRLTFTWFDEFGKQLHQYKQPASKK